MKVLKPLNRIKSGNYTYSLMGAVTEPTHVHIDNHKTNKNSVMVINTLTKLLQGVAVN